MKLKLMRTGFAMLAAGLLVSAGHAQELRGRAMHSGAIVGVGSRLCVELAEASAQEGVRVQLGECRDSRGDWDITELGNSEVAIVNRATGMVLDVEGGSTQDGANIQQWTWNRSGAQRWRVESKAGGTVQLVSVGSGKCLDVSGRSTAPGARLTQYRCTGADNQTFRLNRTGAQTIGDSSGGYGRPGVVVVPPVPVSPPIGVRPAGRVLYTGMIHSRATDKCVDVERASTADGANIFQWSCNATAAQIWDVVDLGRNEIAFVAQVSNKVMDVQGGDRRSAADVRQYSWNNGPTQRWRMENVERGFSRIVNVGSGKCLDLDGARSNDGAEIMQFDCHGGVNQQWRMEISGNNADWRGYNSGRNWGNRNQSYSEEPPAFLVGDFNAYNNYYQGDIQLSIYSDGVVVAVLDGGQRVTGYYRGSQLFLGNARFDIQQEARGFRTTQLGQPGSGTSYVRARYESPRGR